MGPTGARQLVVKSPVIDDYMQRPFSQDVYEALKSTARPKKQNGRVIPDSEDERVLSP